MCWRYIVKYKPLMGWKWGIDVQIVFIRGQHLQTEGSRAEVHKWPKFSAGVYGVGRQRGISVSFLMQLIRQVYTIKPGYIAVNDENTQGQSRKYSPLTRKWRDTEDCRQNFSLYTQPCLLLMVNIIGNMQSNKEHFVTNHSQSAIVKLHLSIHD